MSEEIKGIIRDPKLGRKIKGVMKKVREGKVFKYEEENNPGDRNGDKCKGEI